MRMGPTDCPGERGGGFNYSERMRLTSDARAILGQGPIGMLALRAGRLPLVNPAVFSFASGSLWMTTSRFAAKTMLAQRDPRAAFLVDGGARSVLVRGAIEVFDPLSISSPVRAMLDGPGYVLGMAGYALKNAPFVAGYVLDVTRLPREWLPYNRGVMRLRTRAAEVIEGIEVPAGQAAREQADSADGYPRHPDGFPGLPWLIAVRVTVTTPPR